MEEFKQLEIYLFPIVMLLAIGMNNWKREERTQGDRIFGFLPFLIICMMGSDVTYRALQLYVHRFTVSGVLLLPDSSTVCLAFVCERKAFCAA